MVICEMCGKQVGKGIRIKVDKAILVVGPECTRFGTPVESVQRNEMRRTPSSHVQPRAPTSAEQRQVRKEAGRERDPLERRGGELVLDYSRRIQQARNALGLKQEELAAKLNEKKSVMRELESGSLVPNDALIRKLENQLKIALIENVAQDYKMPAVKRKEMTLGDLMKE